uniref:Uncharacterized protein n=1 Tax=Anguilla anguilla TaxID=7936 RepID=A0A0E9V824_ANGAN
MLKFFLQVTAFHGCLMGGLLNAFCKNQNKL